MRFETPSDHPYQWLKVALRDYRFLDSFRTLYGEHAEVELFWNPSIEFNRITSDGIVCVRGKIDGQTVSSVLTDFRLNGGSFGKENMDRLHHFVREISTHEGSLVFILNTLGVRFSDGRSLFTNVFRVFPDLQEYRKNHLFVAISLGKCLGLGALFFGQAHYRIASGEGSLINLTGPEVLSLFFGGKGPTFESFAAAGHQKKVNTLVHEILPDTTASILRARELVVYPFATKSDGSNRLLEPDETRPKYLKSENALVGLLNQIGDHAIELFPQMSPVSRTFLVRRGQKTIGVIANPPLHPNNLVTTAALDRTQAAMDIFRALRIPILSAIDSPGGDPRASESDSDMVMKMVELVHSMIEYPYGKMGIVTVRCYGGSCMFAFPKIYGAVRNVALEGAKIGVMSEQIISKILEGSPRMLADWSENAKKENADLSDMLASGDLDAVVKLESLGAEIDLFLEMTPESHPETLVSGVYLRGLTRKTHRNTDLARASTLLEKRTGRKSAAARRSE